MKKLLSKLNFKNNFKVNSLIFWIYIIVNVYLIAGLIFVSLQYLGVTSLEKISAFGSILGGVGTVFAALVAIILFNDWKEQHNKTVIASDAKSVFSLLHKELILIRGIDHGFPYLLGRSPPTYFGVNDPEQEQLVNDLRVKMNINMDACAEFIFLVEGTQLHEMITSYRKEMKDFEEDIKNWIDQNKTYDNVSTEYSLRVKNLESANKKILNELKNYVLYKT